MTDAELESNLKIHRYSIELLVIPEDGTQEDTINLSQYINQLNIFCDFDNNIMPYYRFSLKTSEIIARKLREKWKESRVFVTLRTLNVVKKENEIKEEFTNEFFMEKAEFKILLFDNAGGSDMSSALDDRTVQANSPLVDVVLETVPLVSLKLSRAVNSTCYKDVFLSDIIIALSLSNHPKGTPYRLIACPPDNTKKYESIILPALNYAQSLRYLDDVFGLYEGNLIIFLDFARGFILSSAKTTPIPDKKDMFKNVILKVDNKADKDLGNMSGSAFNKETGTALVRSASRVSVAIQGPATTELLGDHLRLINTSLKDHAETDCGDLLADVKSRIKKLSSDLERKEKVFWQKFDNPLIAKRMKILSREMYSPISVSIDSFDLRLINPSLQWRVEQTDINLQAYDGFWRVGVMEVLLNRENQESDAMRVAGELRLTPVSTGK